MNLAKRKKEEDKWKDPWGPEHRLIWAALFAVLVIGVILGFFLTRTDDARLHSIEDMRESPESGTVLDPYHRENPNDPNNP